jgi:hypothetical protein
MTTSRKESCQATAILALIIAIVIVATLFGTSCASVAPQQGAAAVRVTTSTGVTLALSNNPDYASAVAALASGIDAAVTESASIDPTSIAAFVRRICAAHHVREKDIPVFVNLAGVAYQAYVTTYRPQVVSAADPNVVLYLQAFKAGLQDALVAVAPAPAP